MKKLKKFIALFGIAATLAVSGVVVQETARPSAPAEAYSSWWAYTSRCINPGYSNSYIRRTWYKVIDYDWYEETVYGKIDYNYPTLYYPDHIDTVNVRCNVA